MVLNHKGYEDPSAAEPQPKSQETPHHEGHEEHEVAIKK
jgi:hypothetical protein